MSSSDSYLSTHQSNISSRLDQAESDASQSPLDDWKFDDDPVGVSIDKSFELPPTTKQATCEDHVHSNGKGLESTRISFDTLKACSGHEVEQGENSVHCREGMFR